MELSKDQIKRNKQLIYAVSVVVPLVVALLFRIEIEGVNTSFLPPIYATINGVTAVLLIGSLVAIKQKNMSLHRMLIRISLLLSVLFLLCYVVYHITNGHTEYLGAYPWVYYPLLVAHIILSVAVIPVVLLTYLWAWEGNYAKHKKWTKFAFPIWLFVAASGVVVYLMIAPFYQV